MPDTLKKLLDRSVETGRLALVANLLYDVVLIGWLAFAGLYAIETLLPTFVMARLSLVKFALILLMLTSLLVWLGQRLKRTAPSERPEPAPSPLLTLLGISGVGIVTLAHYRFPWWSLPLLVGGYGLIVWLFFKLFRAER